MIDMRRLMIPVSALDAAHMRHPAQGTVYVEVTKDLLDRLHNVSTFVFLGAENLAGYDVNTSQQLAAYGSSENLDPAGSGGVVLGDAAASLRAQFEPRTTTGGQQTCAPRQAVYQTCSLHRKRAMSPNQRAIFDAIRKIPPVHKVKVCVHLTLNSIAHHTPSI